MSTTVSDARLEANRQNALKSTGPRTEAGKARSARNALKHGLAAEAPVVLPVEDAGEYQDGLKAWSDDAGARGPIEEALVGLAFQAYWRLKRADAAEAASATFEARRAADGHDRREKARAVEIGERLIHDPINRCNGLPHEWRARS